MKIRNALGERLGGVVRRPRAHLALALSIALPLFLAALRAEPEFGNSAARASVPAPTLRYDDLARPYRAELPEHSLVLTVEKDDTLGSILAAGGLTAGESAALSHELAKSIDPRTLRPGQMVRFHYRPDGLVDSVQVKVKGWGEVNAVRKGDGFDVDTRRATIRGVEAVVSATIDHSLYDALLAVGEGPQLVQELVDVFQWDIDFFELREGDSFSLIVTKQFAGSDLLGYSPITAARFNHRGKVYEAFRYEGPGGFGYYAADATPLHKEFLKAPLKFTRITSGFSRRRFHPILKYFRPHYGVDYGAPIGTPVMCTADGVVVQAGYNRGEGNFIRVRHSSRIDTCYLHLSRFAKGLKRGTRVHQGQVIGYVGMTGLATGPHLDYRVTQNGKWINPLHLKSITPDPLRGEALHRFRTSMAALAPRLSSPSTEIAEQMDRRRALF